MIVNDTKRRLRFLNSSLLQNKIIKGMLINKAIKVCCLIGVDKNDQD